MYWNKILSAKEMEIIIGVGAAIVSIFIIVLTIFIKLIIVAAPILLVFILIKLIINQLIKDYNEVDKRDGQDNS